MSKKNNSAFTLIELLVVIAIIGILATISVLALSNARAKSRDAKRAGDMKQIQTALELFFNDNNRYPTTEEWSEGKIYSTSTGVTSTYMQVIPNAPTPADEGCTNSQNVINYTPINDGTSYAISFCLGNTTGTLTSGPKCLTPGGITDTDCSSSVCGYNLIDSRDGQIYPTVQIGTQCWLARDINYGTRVSACASGDCSGNCTSSCAVRGTVLKNQANANSGSFEKYCYSDSENNCDTGGGLYQWHTAMALPQACDSTDCSAQINTPHQGICPDGWHVSSDLDWSVLESFYATSTCDPNRSGSDCSPAGHKLKKRVNINGLAGCSSTDPDDSDCGSSGFNVLFSGYIIANGATNGLGTITYYRTTSVFGTDRNVPRQIRVSYPSVFRAISGGYYRNAGWPVRCLKD
ncbi:MAG: FISUMP domain-containing protein [Candidatus Falkowbacteria bacterium]